MVGPFCVLNINGEMKNFLISKILVLFNYKQNLNIILNISGNIKLDSNFFLKMTVVGNFCGYLFKKLQFERKLTTE